LGTSPHRFRTCSSASAPATRWPSPAWRSCSRWWRWRRVTSPGGARSGLTRWRHCGRS